MLARLKSFVRRARANYRAWRAFRSLRARGVLARVSAVQMAMATDSFKNVFRREATARMKARRPLKSADEVGRLALELLAARWKLDTADVHILVDLDAGQTELELTAAPTIAAVHRAHGGVHG